MIYVYIYVEHVYVFICTNQYVCMQQLGCPFKIRKLSVSKQENLLSHSSGGWQSEMTVSAGSVPSEVEREDLSQAPSLTSGALLAIFGSLSLEKHHSVSAFIFTQCSPGVCVCL